MRVQTLSSLRNPGQLMRLSRNRLTTQVDSLRDYCGVTTGHTVPINYVSEQHSPETRTYFQHSAIPTIVEDDESMVESAAFLKPSDQTPYAGYISTNVITNTSGIGQLDAADNSVLLALQNFNPDSDETMTTTAGQMAGGFGLFHHHNDEFLDEPDKLTMYGEQRPLP